MNRFRKGNENEAPGRRVRPLREFNHGSPPQGRGPTEKRWFSITLYWLLPLTVFVVIVLLGVYLALNFNTPGETTDDGDLQAGFSPSSGQIELPELMSAHLDAIGGREALQQVRSVRYEGRVSFESRENDFQMLLLLPDKGMLVTNPDQPDSLKLMLNGEIAWQVTESLDGARRITPLKKEAVESLKWSLRVHNTFRRMALESQFADLSVREIRYDGNPCYEVSKTMPNGSEFTAILEKETLYLLKTLESILTNGDMDVFKVVYDDHRMVSGIVEPYKTTLYRNGKMDNEVSINTIRINTGVISSLFEVPEEIRN
ncbi:MAG TPA: hypothetical protein VJ952_09925 [Opitutales bacterium]|nr:hypothetical protein [Opitutales bacterium]